MSFVVTTPAIMATLLALMAKQGSCQSRITCEGAQTRSFRRDSVKALLSL
jgi:hypothetical protein